VVKRYRRGLLEGWRGRLSSFRVANEFEALQKLESLGERCTRPLFWGYGNFGSHGRGELLATEWQGDCRPLDELLAADPDARRTLDLAPLWAKGEYFPLAFSRGKVEEVTANRLVLKPAAK